MLDLACFAGWLASMMCGVREKRLEETHEDKGLADEIVRKIATAGQQHPLVPVVQETPVVEVKVEPQLFACVARQVSSTHWEEADVRAPLPRLVTRAGSNDACFAWVGAAKARAGAMEMPCDPTLFKPASELAKPLVRVKSEPLRAHLPAEEIGNNAGTALMEPQVLSVLVVESAGIESTVETPLEPTRYTVVWHWGYPEDACLPDKKLYTPGPEWYIHHPETLDEARAIYDSINCRLGHRENRASRVILSPKGEVVDMWAFDQNWAENLKAFNELRARDWRPREDAGIFH